MGIILLIPILRGVEGISFPLFVQLLALGCLGLLWPDLRWLSLQLAYGALLFIGCIFYLPETLKEPQQ